MDREEIEAFLRRYQGLEESTFDSNGLYPYVPFDQESDDNDRDTVTEFEDVMYSQEIGWTSEFALLTEALHVHDDDD